MLVVQVNIVNAETPQRALAGLAHVLGLAADSKPLAIRTTDDPEFRGDHHLIAPAFDRATDQLLVLKRTVRIGGVEECNSQLDRAFDGGDRFGFVGRPIELAHAHAAKAESGHFQASQFSFSMRTSAEYRVIRSAIVSVRAPRGDGQALERRVGCALTVALD